MPKTPWGWVRQRLISMNRNQAIALGVAAINIAFVLLFPPFDVYSIAKTPIPVFGGFDFILNRTQYMVINTSVLVLEVAVVLINTGIAWLLLGTKKVEVTRRRVSLQNATLMVVAVNLVVIILFPPFESVFAITKAAIPTFEGFYFIFARQTNHVIVTTILYLEVFFVLINGALFWLIFRDKKQEAMTPQEAYALMMEMKKRGK